MEISDTAPGEKVNQQEFELTARPENISAIFEMGPALARQLGKPVTFKFEGRYKIDGSWGESVRPKDTPPGPVELIGGLAIDPGTGQRHFEVSALRFNMEGMQDFFDVPGRDIADVYEGAFSGNQTALDAVEALRMRNSESFFKSLRTLRNAGGQIEEAAPPKAAEF